MSILKNFGAGDRGQPGDFQLEKFSIDFDVFLFSGTRTFFQFPVTSTGFARSTFVLGTFWDCLNNEIFFRWRRLNYYAFFFEFPAPTMIELLWATL
jgi:hypothetical protein